MSYIVGSIIGIFLVLLNGLFVAIEFALARVSKTRIENLTRDKKNKSAILILHALDNIDNYISASQVGITISSLALGAIGEISISKLLNPYIEQIVGSNLAGIGSHTVSLVVALTIVTYLHVVIGEIIPKTVAFIDAERTAFALIWPLEFFKIITSPLVQLLNWSASAILKLFGIKDIRTTFVYTEDELKMLLNVSQEEGVLEESEKEMITNIFDFPDTVAREIMTPRTDMKCTEENKSIEEVVKEAIECKHSRIPIYDESIDNITGMITTRDLLEEIHSGNYKKPVKHIAKPVIKVPESKPLDDLLGELKKKSLQMAIIIDEFGGTSGLVTVEDIVEEIVGEIHDEFDKVVEEPIKKISKDDYLIDGKQNIHELNEELDLDFPTEHFDTIGGLTFGLLGKEPKVGDEVEESGYILKVAEKDLEKQRIKQVRLIKKQLSESNKNGKDSEHSKDSNKDKVEEI